MVQYQGPPPYPILETGMVPPYHSLLSFNNVDRIRSASSSNTYCVFVEAYEEEQKRKYIEHIWYLNAVSDDEDKDKDKDKPKQVYNSKGPASFFKSVSRNSNLQITNVREDNVHDLASPGTQLPIQPLVNFILTYIEEEILSSESPQEELL